FLEKEDSKSIFKALAYMKSRQLELRQANCTILRKNNKPDYKQPSAYQPISLLNYLGKVSKRILARRLAYLAETIPNLLHPSQISSRLKKSAIDVGAMLADYVHINRL
ncbi:hypothetical protein LHYA1_G009118, partial [Lachnellula hyalina]